jgi:hypothetical protein
MRILFMGTPDFALFSLRALVEAGEDVIGVVTQPDKPKGRGYALTPPPVKVYAEERGIPVYQPNTLRGEEFAALLSELDPDLAVVGFREIGDYRVHPDLHPTPKMLIVEQAEKVSARLKELEAVFPDLAFCQSQPWLIEVMPKTAGKGLAVAKLAEIFGVKQEEVMTLGDNTNDLPMIRWAGLGVAVGNAVEALKAEADYICIHDETVDPSQPLEIFDPDYTWKRRTLENFTARELMVPIFEKGKLVYDLPPLSVIRNYCKTELASMWEEVLRFENPHNYYVDLSPKLWDEKQLMLHKLIKSEE